MLFDKNPLKEIPDVQDNLTSINFFQKGRFQKKNYSGQPGLAK